MLSLNQAALVVLFIATVGILVTVSADPDPFLGE